MDLVDNLAADLVPEPGRTRRCEGLHLEGGAGEVETDRDHALAAFFYFEAKVEVGAGKDLHSPEVNVRAYRVGLAVIEGPHACAVLRRRLRAVLLVFGWSVRDVAHACSPDFGALYPVEPKPDSPRWLPGRVSTGMNWARVTGMMMSCAIRSPAAIS